MVPERRLPGARGGRWPLDEASRPSFESRYVTPYVNFESDLHNAPNSLTDRPIHAVSGGEP